jgi:hypothetical protein
MLKFEYFKTFTKIFFLKEILFENFNNSRSDIILCQNSKTTVILDDASDK